MGSRLDSLGPIQQLESEREEGYSFLHLDIATSHYLRARQIFFRLQPTHGIARTMTHAKDSTSESEKKTPPDF